MEYKYLFDNDNEKPLERMVSMADLLQFFAQLLALEIVYPVGSLSL